MSRYKWVAKEPSNVVEGKHYRKQVRIHRSLERENNEVDAILVQHRKQWIFHPPSNIVLILHKDEGSVPAGLVLSVPQSIGAFILLKRLGHIIESDKVAIDLVIDAAFEEVIEALGRSDSKGGNEVVA